MFPGVLPSTLSLSDLVFPSDGLSYRLYVVDAQSHSASEHRHFPQPTGRL